MQLYVPAAAPALQSAMADAIGKVNGHTYSAPNAKPHPRQRGQAMRYTFMAMAVRGSQGQKGATKSTPLGRALGA